MLYRSLRVPSLARATRAACYLAYFAAVAVTATGHVAAFQFLAAISAVVAVLPIALILADRRAGSLRVARG
jgi:hypothetical protein